MTRAMMLDTQIVSVIRMEGIKELQINLSSIHHATNPLWLLSMNPQQSWALHQRMRLTLLEITHSCQHLQSKTLERHQQQPITEYTSIKGIRKVLTNGSPQKMLSIIYHSTITTSARWQPRMNLGDLQWPVCRCYTIFLSCLRHFHTGTWHFGVAGATV